MLNKAIISGRLVAAPEMRTTTTGKSVAGFTVAVERDFKGAGDKPETDFINCTAWDKTAEFVCKYFGKGSRIAVDGRIQTRKYQDKDGNNRTVVEVVAERVYFCDSKQPGQMAATSIGEADEVPTVQAEKVGGANVNDDDLPF